MIVSLLGKNKIGCLIFRLAARLGSRFVASAARGLLVILRIARIRRIGSHALELIAHWEVQYHVSWRNRAHEPLVVDALNLPGGEYLAQRRVYRGLELRVAATHH